jgi:hypothetical protein
MRRLLQSGLLFVFMAVIWRPADGTVIVNEVMANEPGATATLEWIELYNPGASANLSFYQLVVGVNQIGLSGVLDSGAYMIVCRRLLSSDLGPGFESVWGNNSGTWGDAPGEQFRVYEASFSLTNSAGSVQLKVAGIDQPALSWTESGKDGVSWERITATATTIKQSEDYTGATPGFVNSVTPLPSDLTIDTVAPFSHNGTTDLTITVENVGLNQLADRRLLIFDRNAADSSDERDTLALLTIQILDPGFKTDLTTSLNLSGLYHRIGLRLQGDDRVRNNRLFISVPAAQFPPLTLSEILPNPALPLTSEWIELKNSSPVTIDLAGWRICDANSCHVITNVSTLIQPDSLLVVCEDSIGIRLFYPQFESRLVQPSGWPTLNNDSDQVTLVDSFGYIADQFSYTSTYPDNYSWSFSDSNGGTWGRSTDQGGTPGEANSVLFAPEATRTDVTVSPRVFSPDGDRLHDHVEILVAAVPASGYTLRVYDRTGRQVKQFFENIQFLQNSYSWDGRSDAGNRLPVGIYIVYFEAVGVEQVKKTVVIAR